MASHSDSGPLLAVGELSLTRGGRDLFSALSFDVLPGQLIQLEGANGAGKTSLLRILAGLSRYGYGGQVRRLSPLIYLGHKAAVKSLLTPRENLAWHVDGQGEFSTEQVDHALAQVGLYGYEDLPSHSLSAGQHRRVNLARLYLTDCPVWLLDEPFTAIDRDGVASLQALFLSHVRAGGAVLLTSHQALSVDHTVGRLCLQEGLIP
jgi:heme exporter protein A